MAQIALIVAKTMKNIKICPLCKKENLEDAAICINCGFDLNPSFSADQPDQPDWLESFRNNPESNIHDSLTSDSNSSGLDSSLDDSPDWLARVRERKHVDEEFEAIQDNHNLQNPILPDSKGTNELIDSFRNDTLSTSPENVGADDLINRLRKAEVDDYSADLSTDSGLINKISPEDATDLPIDDDWISRFSQIENSNSEEPQIVTPKNRGAIPEWIQKQAADRSLKKTEDSPENPVAEWIEKYGTRDEPVLESGDESKIPDWIQPQDDEDISILDNGEEESFPAWLADQDSLPVDSMETDEESQPDWIDEINQQTVNEDNPAPEEILPDWITEDSNEDTLNPVSAVLPKKNLETFDEKKAQSKTPLSTTLGLDDKDGKKAGKIETDRTEGIAKPPFQLDQVPNWLENNEDLINTSFFEDKETKDAFVPDSTNQIEPGELPAWLKAMRPLEAIVPAISRLTEKKQIEKSGPLAGLKGVLSSQDSNQTYSPPAMYTSTLNISDKEMTQANILDQLFAEEVDVQTKHSPNVNIGGFLIRLVIPILLVGLLVISSLTQIELIEKPILFPAETVRFASIINGLILNSDAAPQILVVMESEGASQTELEIMTRSVFERLMLKDSTLSIISSTPNGTLLGENLIQTAAVKNPGYDLDKKVSNLGYLPGGSSGIQGFLLDNSKTIYPSSLDEGPDSFSNFSAVLMVTDNPDSAKLWIEQITLHRPQTVMLVAAAAQAVPMLMPYLESNQIDGMEPGLYGAASYAQLIQNEDSSLWSLWTMQKAGVSVFILLIFAGGLWYLAQSLLKSKLLKSR